MAKKHSSLRMLLSALTLIIVSRESQAAAAPTVSITASPTFVTVGEQSRITWSSTNATQCIASGSGWTGSKPLHDSKNTAHLTNSLNFILTCSGPGGSAVKNATVSVSGTATASTTAPKVSLTASPATVAKGGKTMISWSTSNATSCTGSGAWSGNEALSGAKSTGALSTDLTFALTCSGPGGTATNSTTVSVTGAAAATGYATLTWSAPATNTNGTPVTSLSGYHLYYGNSASALTKSVAVSGAKTTSYEISGLTAGTWYFAVAADATDGTEGVKSSVGSKTI
jgi:hypothetical protein